MEQEAKELDLSGLGSFDFTPDWARGDAKVSVGRIRPEKVERGMAGNGERRMGKSFGDRKSSGDRKPFKRSFAHAGSKPFA